jgi:hypothetical protein
MIPVAIAEALATLLWCYAGVLLIVWIRRTAEMGERFHVGMTALLFGSLVPVIGVFLLLLIGAAVLGALAGARRALVAARGAGAFAANRTGGCGNPA